MNTLTKKLSKIGAIALCVMGLGLSTIESAQAFWGGWMSPWNWFGGRHWDYPYWGSPYGYHHYPWTYSPYGWGGHYPYYYGGGYYPYHYGYAPYSYAPPPAAPAASSTTKKD